VPGQGFATRLAIQYASSSDGGSHWNGPFTLSTTTQTNTFPTTDVAGPGKLQFAYYGAPGATGDPDATSRSQPWNVYHGTVSNANTARPKISKPVVAIQGHAQRTYCIPPQDRDADCGCQTPNVVCRALCSIW
jgi:hypothetical protein